MSPQYSYSSSDWLALKVLSGIRPTISLMSCLNTREVERSELVAPLTSSTSIKGYTPSSTNLITSALVLVILRIQAQSTVPENPLEGSR